MLGRMRPFNFTLDSKQWNAYRAIYNETYNETICIQVHVRQNDKQLVKIFADSGGCTVKLSLKEYSTLGSQTHVRLDGQADDNEDIP